jgi:hypothetical protein
VFFVQIFRQSQNVTRKSCQNDVRTKNLYAKFVRKTLMKLTQGRDFDSTDKEISSFFSSFFDAISFAQHVHQVPRHHQLRKHQQQLSIIHQTHHQEQHQNLHIGSTNSFRAL